MFSSVSIFYFRYNYLKTKILIKNKKNFKTFFIPMHVKLSMDFFYFFFSSRNQFLNAKSHGEFLNNSFFGFYKGYVVTLLLIDKNKDGYKFILKIGKNGIEAELKIGKNHKISYEIPDYFSYKIGRKSKTLRIYTSILEELSLFLKIIKENRKPEPYKGKGIFYKYEYIHKKKIKKLRSAKNFKRKRKK